MEINLALTLKEIQLLVDVLGAAPQRDGLQPLLIKILEQTHEETV
jgi:hypothetical protein